MPAISIVIPTLNEEKYLPKLLDSLSQIHSPMEIIVVDGNSTDRTVEVAKGFTPRFTSGSSLVVLTTPLPGVSAQRNHGAHHAAHEILWFLDADVIISQKIYISILQTFINRGYSIGGTFFKPIEHDIRATLMYASGVWYAAIMLLFGRANFSGNSILVKRELFQKVGGFDETLRIAEDIDFSNRAGKMGKAGLIPVAVPVSSRRFKRFGYLHVYSGWVFGTLLMLCGRKEETQKLEYPFGEFN